MGCAQRMGIVYPSIIFRKSLFYNEKVDLIGPHSPPHLAPTKKGPSTMGPLGEVNRGSVVGLFVGHLCLDKVTDCTR
jgi:hypothetical protein